MELDTLRMEFLNQTQYFPVEIKWIVEFSPLKFLNGDPLSTHAHLSLEYPYNTQMKLIGVSAAGDYDS